MKYLKMLGLAAVAATALMAFVGAGTASATVLCKTNLTTNCHSSGWAYPAGTEIRSSLEAGTSAILEDTFGFVKNTCLESSVKGSTANTGSSAETVSGSVTIPNLTFANCTNTTHVLEGGELEIHWISNSDNGTLTAKNFRVTQLIGNETCIYGAGNGTDLGTLTGGAMATMDINAVFNVQPGSGGLCPGTARWTAKYTVTSPEPLYVSTS